MHGESLNFKSGVRGCVTIWLGMHRDEASIDSYVSDTENANNLSMDFGIERERTYQAEYVFGEPKPIDRLLESISSSIMFSKAAQERAEVLGLHECCSALVVYNLQTDFIPTELKIDSNKMALLGSFQFKPR